MLSPVLSPSPVSPVTTNSRRSSTNRRQASFSFSWWGLVLQLVLLEQLCLQHKSMALIVAALQPFQFLPSRNIIRQTPSFLTGLSSVSKEEDSKLSLTTMSTASTVLTMTRMLHDDHGNGDNESSTSRRQWVTNVGGGTLTALVATAIWPTSAEALYSTYARREDDWKNRKEHGEIQYSSASALRRQLAELVPANSEGSKIFCPNGTPSNVSPMMENRCSDSRVALPSVYGRSQDTVGNSIPGFRAGYFVSGGGNDESTKSSMLLPSDGKSLLEATGGFSSYYTGKK